MAIALILSSSESVGADNPATSSTARTAARGYPDQELRAIFCRPHDPGDREAALREIRSDLDKIRVAGFNTLFLMTQSRYLAALDEPELQKSEPQASWDVLAEMIRAAQERSLQVHMWYSPWIYKNVSSYHHAIELQKHPEWAAVSATGKADPDGVCFVRPEVRAFELDLISKAIDRYPGLAGIHIEEAGFGSDDQCYCDHCREVCRQLLGIDIRKDARVAQPAVSNLAASMSSDFFIRLRAMVKTKRPGMWLSTNGCGGNNPDRKLGRDWTSWAHRGYIDFYVPQIYLCDVDAFVKTGLTTKSYLGNCDMIPAIGITWFGLSPKRQLPETIKAEIVAARAMGAKGFAVYYQGFFTDEYYEAVRQSIPTSSHSATPKKPS